MKTFLLGSKDVVLSFRAVGVDGTIVSTSEEMIRELDKLTSDEDTIVMVEESIALTIENKINELRKKGMTIVEVPSPFTTADQKDFGEFLKKVLRITI